jgi:hypothetical protein
VEHPGGRRTEIAPDFSFSATYTHNRSENLRTGGFFSTPWDRNLDPTGVILNSIGQSTTDGLNPTFNLPRLAANIDNANAVASFGKARYHALIFQLKKTYSHRYQLGVNYVVSTNKDNSSSDRDTDAFNGPSDPFNSLALDYGRSQLDIRHRFTFYSYIMLPWDIEFSNVVSARTGRAFPVWGNTCSDPGVVAPFGLEGTGSPFHYRNSFQCSNNFDQIRPVGGGNEVLARYPTRNNAFFNWDFRIGREFPLGSEKVKLRATFEVFDLFDHKNFFTNPTAGRNAILGDSDFRQRDQFQTTRTAQFGLKILF